MEQKFSGSNKPMKDAKLFSPFKLGPYSLSHRVVLAPLTRMRTVKDMIPTDLMAEYYTQRATEGGFMLTEATIVSPTGDGYWRAPGQFTDAQTEGWKKITEAVHKKGATIFQQFFHVGRQSHVTLQPNGAAPIAPSAVPDEDLVCTPTGWLPTSPARAMEIDEIHALVEDFHNAARRAKEAGFDGVELHGANGYIVDQFLQDGTNHRTDAYGGSLENRTRFLKEVVEGMTAVWGSDKVGVRLSPSGTFGSMSDSNPAALFDYAVDQLNQYDLAYLHLVEPRIKGSVETAEGLAPIAAERLRKIFMNTLIAAGGFDRDGAEAILQKGNADLVAFGRWFVSNPDLPRRFQMGYPLAAYDRNTFYGGDAHGYTDYKPYLL